MRSLTLGQVRSKLARVIGCCTTDARIAEMANEAQERLLNRPNSPVGSWQRYRVCTVENCLVWPRQVRTILAWWLCDRPGRFFNEWFETIGFYEGGRGLLDTDDHIGVTLIDRGTACSFDNVTATSTATKRIQVVASDASDNGKLITLRYIDSNGNEKYSSIGGTVQKGEQLTLSTTGALTTSTVATGGLYQVVKAVTNYPVRLYEWDVTGATQSKLIAVYEASETNPIYRRTFLPGIQDMAGCDDTSADDSCTNKAVTIVARLQHVPVVVDNDPFVIGNLGALADMVQSLLMKERHDYEAAQLLEANAARELDGEIAAYLGDGMSMTFRVEDKELYGGGGIMNPV